MAQVKNIVKDIKDAASGIKYFNLSFNLILLLAVLFLAGCAEPVEKVKVFRIGAIHPLTGEGAVYGLTIQKVIEKAGADINAKWKGKKLEVEFDDGKCNGKDALGAAKSLLSIKSVKVIYGGTCSGETLGIAPFAESSKMLVFSSLSSSPDISKAGDYVFRNYPSDTAQVAVITRYVKDSGHKTVALLSENTDYAQALRNGYKEYLVDGVKLVADEVVNPNAKDVRTEMLKIKEAKPDAVILLPQTIPMAGVFAKQWIETGMESAGYGNDIINLGDTLKEYGKELEGFVSPRASFNEENEAFQKLKEETQCDLGYYCATTYDGLVLLAELIEKCGDNDTDCLKRELYATQGWEGAFGIRYSFDENGDVGGRFDILVVRDGKAIPQ